MRVRVGDQVEGDVDAAGSGRHLVRVLVDRLLVERVELGRLGRSPGGPDLVGHRLEARARAAGQEHPGALAAERASDGAADRSGAPVDDGDLVLEQHVCLLMSRTPQCLTRPSPARNSTRRTLGIVRKVLRRLVTELDPQSLGVLCLGLRAPRLSPSRVGLAHRHEPDLLPDRSNALWALLELERAKLVVWTPARRDELPEPHYLLTRRGRRLARWLVTASPSAPAAEQRAA
jgi:hypothetical protein